jgi:hypothetical protein
MISPVSSATQAQAVAQPKAATQPAAPAAQSKAQASPTDTVKLSSAAQIQQEAVELPSQTAKEAAGGDAQARRLLAKEAADNVSLK